jgi:uncharacterized protein YhaN
MRIRRLDFLAYGHFTDKGFDLPANQPDLHFVFGMNEAGKSTALSAIEDLLFGIPHNSPHNFLHDYGSMRLGAVVEGNGDALEFMRRKGTKDTLLSKDGVPLPSGEAALATLLKGADRPFYARMFCLDHERLRQGGREILEAQDDVGQILFSAGAGIAGLRVRIKKLHSDADALWGSRRASHRKYFHAEDRLKTAESALREHTVTASRWHDLKTALDSANEAYQALETEMETKTAEARKLNRIRRVCRDVQKHADLSRRIGELGDVVSLPEDASVLLNEAMNADSHAQTRLAALTEQIGALGKERGDLTYDESLLARSDDIEQLHERRIQVRAGKADLPKRRAELAIAEGHLNRLAAELDWQLGGADLILARLPARSKLASARSFSKRRGELIKAVESSRSTSDEADERIATLTQELGEAGSSIDFASLAATISAVREMGDINTRLATAEKEIRSATDTIQQLLKFMRPAIPDANDLISMTIPNKSAIEHHRGRSRELAQRRQTCRDQIRDTELLLNRHRKEYERTAGDEHAVAAGELQRLRQRRDAGWSIIRRKYVEGAAVSDAETEAFAAGGSLPVAYETAIRDADSAADQRFETAETTARLAEIARQIAEQEENLEQLRGQDEAYSNDETTFDAEWLALWEHIPLRPLHPEEMLGWIDTRSRIVQAIESKVAAERQAADLRDEEARARNLLAKELDALSVETNSLAVRPLRVVLELAADIQRQYENKSENRLKLEEALKKATAESARKRKGQQEAEQAFTEWRGQWSAAIDILGLDSKAAAETIDAQIDAIDEMREVGNRINDLRRERIEKIERDIAAFESEVADVVASIAPQLADLEREQAVLELERLLKEATRARELATAVDVKLSAEQRKAEECEQARRRASEVIGHLQRTAAVSSVDDLRDAIQRSDEIRSLQGDHQAVAHTLAQDGDGISLAELAEECAAIDLDQIAAREQTFTQELSDLRNRLMEAREARSAARRDFDAIGGDDRAARAAADRQAALSEMKDIAEEYVRLRSAELLLQWTVDRFRREKQAPLLKRAGELFAVLTGGSFKDLQLEFDDQDNMQLAGIRDDGRKVTVSGMSTGSADQLYLALRVAAVEDHLSHSAPLPFIADDLFINFDDERAATGFKVLRQLAQKTQVLFFTHHQHLLDVANAAPGTKVSTVFLHLDAAVSERHETRAPSVERAATA